MAEPRAVGSVIIPAWNEARVIGDTLRELHAETDPGELEIVVACNGCTDRTAEVVEQFEPPIAVLDLPAVGKVGAIRAAEVVARAMPRLYLDADVRLPGRSAVAVLEAMRNGAIAARPPVRYDTTGASWLVRRFYVQRERLPIVQGDLSGAGVYGLSETARARFDGFPDVVADDLFAARIVDPDEVTIVPCVPVTVVVPKKLSSLTRTLARVNRGNRELAERMPNVARPTTRSTVRQLVRSVSSPGHALDAAIYAGVVTIGRVRSLSPDRQWMRDETSRVGR